MRIHKVFNEICNQLNIFGLTRPERQDDPAEIKWASISNNSGNFDAERPS